DGRDAHDTAATLLQQWAERMDRVGGRAEIQAQHPFPFAGALLARRHRAAAADVAHQHVELTERLRHARAVGGVLHVAAQQLEFGLRSVARVYRDAATFLAQDARDL